MLGDTAQGVPGRYTHMSVSERSQDGIGSKSNTTNKRETMREKQERRTSKQELCKRLKSLEPDKSLSPDRVSRLYAMLQSTDKGASILSQNTQKNLFNEHIKMSKDQSMKLNMVSDEIRKL